MKKILQVFLVLILFQQIIPGCQKNTKDFKAANLFKDGILARSINFFNLLDPYPVIKQSVSSMQPEDFNYRLDNSLRVIPREDIIANLRMIQNVTLVSRAELQNLLSQSLTLLRRIRNNNPATYQSLQPLLERIRNYHQPVIRNVIPITTSYLKNEYDTKSSVTITNQINSFVDALIRSDSINLMEKSQDLAVKAIRTNTNFRAALEQIANAFLDPSFSSDKKLKNGLIGVLYGSGEMFWKRGGYSDSKSSETVVKELIVNLEKYFTVGGANYSATYSYSDATAPAIGSAEVGTVMVDLYAAVRKLILPPAVPVTKDPNAVIVDKLATALQLVDFTSTVTGAENTLLDMIYQDSNGKLRHSDGTSSSISALESLFLTLGIVDSFGYVWDTTTLTNNWITGPSYGELRIGDSLWSLQSSITGNPLGFKNILNLSKNSGMVYKDGIALTGTKGIDLNTAELALLDKESIGAALPIEGTGTDTIYRKTIPWVLNWIVRVVYGGYGPYYNVNKKDSSGNYLAPDGTIARYANGTENKYKPTWSTAKYKICVSKSGGVTKDIGLGGTEYANCSAGNPGTGFTIYEVTKSDSERAVSSDEEAFYKNFQWLLYEKRLVVVIPARAKFSASLAFEESLFIVAIGNGLKGMMSLKPYCSGSTSDTCGGASNGKWLNDTSKSLRNTTTTYQDLTPANFSNIAGDSVVYLQGWGYAADGAGAFQEAFVLATNAVWPLLIPNPNQVYGMIPPPISFNFTVLERLGFTTNATVPPSSTSTYWSKRNRILPLITALAKVLDDQTDVATNKNAYSLLTDLTKILIRPYLYKDTDNNTFTNYGASARPIIINFRFDGGNDIMRNPQATAADYRPSDLVFTQIAFMIESKRRYEDGILNLVAKTDTVSRLINMVALLGESSRTSARNKIIPALQNMLKEIKIDSDGATASNQFNLQQYINEKRDELAAYPDNKSTNVADSSWWGVDDSISFIRDYASRTSGYSLVKSLDFILDMIIDVRPSSAEITAAIDMVDSLLTKDSNGRYNLTNITTSSLPPILRQVAPYGRNFFIMFYALATGGSNPNPASNLVPLALTSGGTSAYSAANDNSGFINYMENHMTYSPYSVDQMIQDLEKLLDSNMIKSTANSEDSLLYSTGTLISIFTDIYQYGKKVDYTGFGFADGLNVNEKMTVWEKANIIFSAK